jgi:hypothetical protein
VNAGPAASARAPLPRSEPHAERRAGAVAAVDYAFVHEELNAEAREIRKHIPMRDEPGDLTDYIRCWSEDDVLDGKPCKALVVILKTRGCTWALAGGCTMCGYANESAWQKVTAEQLVAQFDKAWRQYAGEALVKIYTSGSFLDRHEVMPEAQRAILERIATRAVEGDVPGVRKVAFESLPGFIDADTFGPISGLVPKLEVGIGVESCNDRVLRDSVNKGHGFAAFPKAAAHCRDHGVSVKAYLMCKPPFLTEADALVDATTTIIAAAPDSDVVSLNPTNVQGRTVVDALFRRGRYRAPWLWTIVHALRDGDEAVRVAGFTGILKSDVIAAGQSRGAHNCGACDERVVGYLKQYKATQERGWLNDCLAKVQCRCREEWALTVELGALVPAYGQL